MNVSPGAGYTLPTNARNVVTKPKPNQTIVARKIPDSTSRDCLSEKREYPRILSGITKKRRNPISIYLRKSWKRYTAAIPKAAKE